jgi:hypothetical protein
MQSQSVVSRVIAGETLIVPVRGGVGDLASIYSLNDLGSFLWQQLNPPKTFSELVNSVVNEYEVSSETAQNDIRVFLDKIKDAGLIAEMASVPPAKNVA